MPDKANFRVLTIDNLIKVNLEGIWEPSADIAYLTELSAAMRSLRNKPWALAVDMRGWIVTDEMRDFKSKTPLHMDRRNQKIECWIVEDMAQGSHLFHFIEKARIPFKRCLDVTSANTWMAQYGYSL